MAARSRDYRCSHPCLGSPPTLQALQPAAGGASACSLLSEDRPSLEAEAWMGPARSVETGHVKPAEVVTLNQAKASLRLPALVHCLNCPWVSPERRDLSLLLVEGSYGS